MKKFIKNNWFGLITVALSVGVLSFAVAKTGGFGVLIENIREIDIYWLFAIILSVIFYWLLDAFVLNRITKTEHKYYPYWKSFITGMTGLMYNALTPFAVGGQPMQIYEMSKSGIKSGDASSYITIKSIIYQTCMMLFSIFALLFAGTYFVLNIQNFALYVVFGIIFNSIFIGLIFFACVNVELTKKVAVGIVSILAKFRLIKEKEKKLTGCIKQISVFYESLQLVKNKISTLILCVIVTFLQIALFYFIPYCILRSFVMADNITNPFGGSIHYLAIYMISANAIITMITSFVPLPGASGAAEGSFYLFFSLFFPAPIILPAVLVWRFATYYSCIIAGMAINLFKVLTNRTRIS